MIREEDIKNALRHLELKKVFASNAEETLPPEWKELLEDIRAEQTTEKEMSESKPKTYTFLEALETLEEGKQITRLGRQNIRISDEDIWATDWIIKAPE